MPREPFEILYVDRETVACDGGGGPLGHPLVYLTIGEEGAIDCPYCSRRFALRREAAGAAPGR